MTTNKAKRDESTCMCEQRNREWRIWYGEKQHGEDREHTRTSGKIHKVASCAALRKLDEMEELRPTT